MKKKERLHLLAKIIFPLVFVAVFLAFLSSLSSISAKQADEEQRQLENIIRQTAVACYAIEGCYPQNLQYLEDHYGVQIDHERYAVIYSPIASNLMPDITVIKEQ